MIDTDQLILEFDHRPSLSGEDFLVAPNNADAVNRIDMWPDWPAFALCIYGPAGCGKTHLSEVFRTRSGAQVLEMDPDGGGSSLPEGNVAIIENIDTVLPRDREEYLFHVFNDLKSRGGNLFLTAEHPPSRWKVYLADLRSRLMTADVIEIRPPDDSLIAAVLVKLFGDRQLNVSADVITYAVSRMERSFHAARQFVEMTDRTALSEKRRITIPLVKNVLEQLEPRGE